MDVYKPHKARMTVKTSSYCSNRYYYQFPTWMTDGTEPRNLVGLGRRSCKQLADLGKLTLRRLVKWTQPNVDYLKGVVKAARIGLAKGIVKLASGAAKFMLWDGESCRVEIAMGKDQVAVIDR